MSQAPAPSSGLATQPVVEGGIDPQSPGVGMTGMPARLNSSAVANLLAATATASSGSDRTGGSGLGLAIAEGQSRVLGGELELLDDEGAVAIVHLPSTARVAIGAAVVGEQA